MDRQALITAREAAAAFQTTIQVILMWRNRGWLDADGHRHHLAVAGYRGRSPLYRWTELCVAAKGAAQSRARTGLPPRARLDTPYGHRTRAA